jgi:tetratricopeptide (TPR) repeat protein
MKKLLVLLLWISCQITLSGQDSRLAHQYFQSGEYEKAAVILKKLFQKNQNSDYYFQKYIEALIAMEDYETAENDVKSEIKKHPGYMQLYVTYGNLLERQFREEEANEQYQLAIENIPPDVNIINKLGTSFNRLARYDQAIEVYMKGSEVMNNDRIFAYNIADLHRQKGQVNQMIKYYILASNMDIKQIERFKTYFQRNLTTQEHKEELRKQLYEKIQEEPDNVVYPELLEWVYIEKSEYKNALRQARAMDRKYGEDGTRVKNIGDISYDAGDYETAIKAYEYVTQNKSINNDLYIDSKRLILQSKRKQITGNYNYTQSDLDTLQKEYEIFIEEFGANSRTQSIVKEYADFLALYRNDLDSAIDVLNDLVGLQSIDKNVRARSKISLADYYLMQGDIWESTLLYSQVEKNYKEEYLGEVSRFKNAKLFYYAGNFEWAQEQFSILKSATTRLIANDAIDMSVFITDNMGLDTTDIPLKMFSESELLTVQNKYDEAFQKLDSIILVYPEHGLEDDVKYQKANLYLKLRDYQKALDLYTDIYTNYVEEIRADNSLFAAAEINEFYLEDLDRAKELYEKLFIDFSNSTYAVEARKRYRRLRGDNLQ